MGKLDDKVAIITGATSGMGRATAKLFAKEGAKVLITGRNEERAKEVVDDIKKEGGTASYVIVDMSNLDEIQKIYDKAMDEYGTVDILYNNAGMSSMTPLMDVSIEEWNYVFNVNVTSSLVLTQLIAPVMKEKGKGVIINTCSLASCGGHYAVGAYVSSKHAIAGLTKSMAWELGPEIRCNGIAPGGINTAIIDDFGGVEVLEKGIPVTPMRRYGEPEDIASFALFLATDESSFIDGQVIRIDGGFEA